MADVCLSHTGVIGLDSAVMEATRRTAVRPNCSLTPQAFHIMLILIIHYSEPQSSGSTPSQHQCLCGEFPHTVLLGNRHTTTICDMVERPAAIGQVLSFYHPMEGGQWYTHHQPSETSRLWRVFLFNLIISCLVYCPIKHHTPCQRL